MPRLSLGIKRLVNWPFTKAHHTELSYIDAYSDSGTSSGQDTADAVTRATTCIYSWNDTTVPPKGKTWSYMLTLTAEQHVHGTRNVFQFGKTTCMTAYAITFSGAVKLVKYFEKLNANVDGMLSWLCSNMEDLVCLAMWPQNMTAADTKSNIDHDMDDVVARAKLGEEPVVIKPGPGLQYSAWRYAGKILDEGAGRIAERYACWTVNESGWDFRVRIEGVVDEE